MNQIKNILQYFVVLVLGILQALSYAPVLSGLLQITSLAALLLIVRHAEKPARVAFVFATAWLSASLYWLYFSMHDVGGLPMVVTVAAVLLLSMYLAVYYALAIGAWCRFSANTSVFSYLLAFPAFWVLAELARGYVFGGLPWVISGYAHIDNPLLKGWLPIFGIYSVGYGAAVFAGALAYFVRTIMDKKRDAKNMALIIGSVGGLAVLGLIVQGLNWSEKVGEPISVNIIQPNVAQTIKFDRDEIIKNTDLFLQQATDSKAQLTVFPETALPYPWEMVPEKPLSTLKSQLNQRAVLMGSVGVDATANEFYNSGMWLTSDSDMANPQRFDKIHLMPFGEMIPWGFNWFVKAMNIPLGGYGYGKSFKPFELNSAGQHTRVGVNICYEIIFGEELTQSWQQGDTAAPNVWVNMTNLGWFGKVNQSTAQQQLLQMSRARALEMARPVIAATNTGISAHIDAAGNVIDMLQPDVAVSQTVKVQGTQGMTPYVGWGNRPVFAFISVLFGAVVFLRHRKDMDI